jgi:hypothetical protein
VIGNPDDKAAPDAALPSGPHGGKGAGAWLARAVITVIAISLGTVVSGPAALAGAMAAGLSEGGWNWQFLVPLYVGWPTGLVLSILTGVIAATRRLSMAAVLAWTLGLPSAFCFTVSLGVYALR